MARHRSTRGSLAMLNGLTARTKLAPGRRKHRPAARRAHRHPLAAVAASVVAAGIFVGSQPVSVPASAATSRSEVGQEAVAARAADADVASRDERSAVDPILVSPPSAPGEDEVLTPELNESGSGVGATGSAALTGLPCPTEGFGGVEPHVAQAGYHLITVFGLSESDVGGVANRPGNPDSDHPRGLALDFMVDTATGDGLAAYAEEHSSELGINYILWQVPSHYDHVHISFNEEPGSGMTC